MTFEVDPDISAALGTVKILTAFSFSFMDEAPIDIGTTSTMPNWAAADFGPRAGHPLINPIQGRLYDRCYAHRDGQVDTQPPLVEADSEFGLRLAQANSGRERWDAGWVIYHFGAHGQIYVRKGDRERTAMPGTFIADTSPGVALQIGASVRLRAASGAFDIQPGYYFAFGETLDELAEQMNLVRVYFNCSAASAAPLLAALTLALNRFQIPFQIKAPTNPILYNRADAVVLYCSIRYFMITARLVDALREIVSFGLTVPLFTKRLWPGIGVAAEPGNGESFGSHRCRLAAEGIVDAWREGRQDVASRITAVAARFAAAGLDISRPYLGPGWVDVFSPPQSPTLP